MARHENYLGIAIKIPHGSGTAIAVLLWTVNLTL